MTYLMTYDEQLKSLEADQVWQNKKNGKLIWVYEIAKYFYIRCQIDNYEHRQIDYGVFLNNHIRIE